MNERKNVSTGIQSVNYSKVKRAKKKIHKPEKTAEIGVGIALQKRHIRNVSCQNE